MVRTMDELNSATEDELLSMVKEAEGVTNKEKFQERFPGTEFSYSAITNRLGKLGYLSGFYHPKWKDAYDSKGDAPAEPEPGVSAKTIAVNSDEKRERYNLAVLSSTKRRYEAFLKGKNFPFKHTTAALELYMASVKDGSVKVTLE